jgi:predicted Zn-dependent protease
MKKNTEILLKVLIIVVLVVAAGVLVWKIIPAWFLGPNEYKLTDAGTASIDNAEKAFASGDDAKGWEELNKAKDLLRKAVKVKANYYKAHYQLGRACMIEVEKTKATEPDKARAALEEAEMSFKNVVVDLGQRQHMASEIGLCKIYDQYRPNPEFMRIVAQMGLTYQKEHPTKPGDPEYDKLFPMQLQLHYYLAKSISIMAQRRLNSLMYEVGGSMADQDRKLAYAETAVDFKKESDEYTELKNAALAGSKLPEGVTPVQVYCNLGEIELHLLDCYSRIYDGKAFDFTGDPDVVAKRKKVYTDLGILTDPETPAFKDVGELRKEIDNKATKASIRNAVDANTVNYFDLARATAEDAVKSAATDSDREKAASEYEATLLAIGRDMCLYGVPVDISAKIPRAGEIYLDDIRKEPSISKTETFYVKYADILSTISKQGKAQEVLEEGMKALNTPALHLAMGRFLASQNSFLDARREFEAVLSTADEQDPAQEISVKDAHYDMADLLITMAEKGNKQFLKDAGEHVDWLAQKYPDDFQCMVLKGRMYMQNEADYAKAEEVFRRMYEMGGVARVQGAYMLGILDTMKGDKRAAEGFLLETKTTMGAGASWGVYMNLANIYVGRDWQKALDLCDEYISYAREQGRPVETPILVIKAQCQAAIGQKEAARKTYDELIDRGESTIAVQKGEMLLRGFVSPKDVTDAQAEFQGLIDKEKDQPVLQRSLEAYYGLVRCKLRVKKDDTKGALSILEGDMKPIIPVLVDKMKTGTADEQMNATNRYKRYLAELYDICKQATSPDQQKLSSIAEEMARVAPNDPDTLGRLLSASGPGNAASVDEERAKALIEKAATPEEKQAIQFACARTYLLANNLDKAEQWFREVLQAAPENFDAARSVAEIYLSQGQTDKAKLDDAQKAIEWLEQKFPDNQQVVVLRVQLDASRAPTMQDRINVLRQAVDRSPDLAQMHALLAQAYVEAAREGNTAGDPSENYQHAIDEYKTATKMSGSNMALSINLAVAHLNLARRKLLANQTSSAKADYEECGKIAAGLHDTYPENPDYTRWLAECRSVLAKDRNDVDDAISLYEEAIAGKIKELDDALIRKDDARVKELTTDIYYAYNDLVAVLARIGDSKKAEEYTTEMSKYAFQASEKLVVVLAHARALEAAKKFDDAVAVYEDGTKNTDITGNAEAQVELYRQYALFYSRMAAATAKADEKAAFAAQQMKVLDAGIQACNDAPPLVVSKAELLWRRGDRAAANDLLDNILKTEEQKDDKDKNPNLYMAIGLFREAQATTTEDLTGPESPEQYFKKATELTPLDQPKEQRLNFYLRHIKVFKEQAGKFVSELRAKSPDRVLYMTFEARFLVATGDFDGAIAIYRDAAAKEPTNETVYAQWKDTLLQKPGDNTQEAVNVLKQGLAANPLSSNLKTALGLLYLQTDTKTARDLFQQVLKVNDKDLLALEGVGYLAANDLVNPEVVPYDNALAEARKAIRDDLYSRYPDNVVVQRLMGILCLHEGDVPAAVEYLKQAYSMNRDTLSLSILSHLALDRQTVRVDTAALKAWATDLGGWKDDADMQVFVGRCSMMAGEDGADSNFEAASALAGETWPNPYVFLDAYYQDRVRLSDADKAFQGVMDRLKKNDVAETRAYALTYVEAGYPDRAVQLLEAASASDKTDKATGRQYDALRAYIYLFELNDAAKAKEIAQMALDAAGDPKPADALCVIGKTMCDAGDFDNGILKMKDAAKTDPSNPRYRLALALAYYNKYQAAKDDTVSRDDAQTAIEAAVRADPYGFPIKALYLWLGDVYVDQGKKEEAAGAYMRFFELGGKMPQGREDELAKQILFLGDTYFGQGNKAEAAAAYKMFFDLGGKAPPGR